MIGVIAYATIIEAVNGGISANRPLLLVAGITVTLLLIFGWLPLLGNLLRSRRHCPALANFAPNSQRNGHPNDGALVGQGHLGLRRRLP